MSKEHFPNDFYNGFAINENDITAERFLNNQGEIKVESWGGLMQVISFFTRYPCYWRGHTNSTWEIDSTAKRQNLDENDLLEQLEIFKKASRTYIPKNTTDEEILVLGRHHGLATPLIDFSETAYKALFFACEEEVSKNELSNNRRTLWAFDRQNFEGWDRESKLVKDIYTHTHRNNRLIAQDGLIIRLSVTNHLEGVINQLTGGDNEPLLIKITFPEKIREEALINLMHMGITHKTIYPSLEGAAMFSNMALKIKGYQKWGVSKPPK